MLNTKEKETKTENDHQNFFVKQLLNGTEMLTVAYLSGKTLPTDGNYMQMLLICQLKQQTAFGMYSIVAWYPQS